MKPIRVLLSDFQFLTREGLINLIRQHNEFELIGVSESHEGLLNQVHTEHPDVVILDYEDQDPGTLSLLKQLVQTNIGRVLIVTNYGEPRHIQNLLELGVKGIVTKKCSKLEIMNAIHSISKNNRFYCNRILDTVIDGPEEAENCEPTDLSPREYEVLQLITKGHKTTEIAETLNLSVHTINSHRKNILRKLGMKSPAELIVYALESKLIQV